LEPGLKGVIEFRLIGDVLYLMSDIPSTHDVGTNIQWEQVKHFCVAHNVAIVLGMQRMPFTTA